jgi:hypothetical protein
MNSMRVDVTAREVGSFFGGKKSAAVSIACPECGKPGLLCKNTIKNGKRVKQIAHGFLIKLNAKNDPEIEWDEPCQVAS